MPLNRSEPLDGILLLAHGGPDSLQDIEPFLRNIRGGRSFSPALLQLISDRYRQIGGRSPLLEISRRQAAALEREMALQGNPVRVYLGMRNWRPFIPTAMEEIRRDEVGRLVALCLAPHYSRMTVGLYFQQVRDAQKELGLNIPTSFVQSWHDEPQLIEAFAEKLHKTLREWLVPDAPPAVIFTAHSLPEKILSEGDPYDREARATAAAVAGRCNLANWKFAYQSQGATAEPWLGPTVESTIKALAADGIRHVAIAPVGFLADHVEILYDIDIHFRQFAKERRIELRRTESLNDDPKLIRAMAAVVSRNFAGIQQ